MKTRLSIIAVIISLTLWLGCIAAIAAPIDQNFDNISLGSKGNPSYTQDGITYTTNDSSAQISIVNDGSIASGDDHALSFRSSGKGTTSLVKFKAQDGASFKLNSFVLANVLGNIGGLTISDQTFGASA